MNTIVTYDDLMQEKYELEAQLVVLRATVEKDLEKLKTDFQPVTDLVSFMGKITTKDNSNSLLTAGIDIVGDVLIKRVLLARSGWMVKLIVPYFIKNYSTHLLSKNGASIFHALAEKWKQRATNNIR
jgi:hypothetical protein